MGWMEVEEALEDAVAITWDGCHKIYVLMDLAQVEQMVKYEYDPIIPVTSQEDTLTTLRTWFAQSCGLRFIEAVAGRPEDPNEDFTSLIYQFEFDRFDE